MDEKWQVFPAQMERYEEMLSFVLQRAVTCGVPQERMLKLQLGFEEAVVNVIHYAYDGRKTGNVWIRAELENGDFCLELADGGRPFNPLAQDDALSENAVQEPLETRKIGGLGIALFRRVFDEVRYSYEHENGQKGNLLTMIVHLQGGNGDGEGC